VPVNGLQVCGVEISGRPFPDLYLDKPVLNVFGFGDHKRVAASRSQLILERLSVEEGVSGQGLGAEVQRVKARQDLGLIDFAADEGVKDLVTFRAWELTLYPIVGCGPPHGVAAALHFRGADLWLRLWFRLSDDAHQPIS
jgi:hypothetical protein